MTDNPLTTALAVRSCTRRSFLGAAGIVGVLTFLGSACGGRVRAFADEAGQHHFVVYVINREEVPIQALDVSAGAEAARPVAGARLTLVSLAKGREGQIATAKTDEYGSASINVRDLSEDFGNPALDTYAAYCNIIFEAEGMRQARIPAALVRSGYQVDDDGNIMNLIQIATQPVNGQAYLRCAAIDGEDVQYTPSSGRIWTDDDYEHEILVDLMIDSRASGQARLTVNGNPLEIAAAYASGTADEQGVCSLSFKAAWLDGKHGIQVGDELGVIFCQLGRDWSSCALKAQFEPALVAWPGGYSEHQAFSPGTEIEDVTYGYDTSADHWATGIPGWLNALDNTFNCAIPGMPLTVFGDAYGNMGAVISLLSVPFYSSKDGVRDVNAVTKTFKSQLGQDGWKKFKDDVDKAIDNICQGYEVADTNSEGFAYSKVSTAMDIKLDIDAMIYGSCMENEYGQHRTEVNGALRATFSMSYTWAQQLIVGFVPVWWSFSIGLTAIGRVAFGMNTTDDWKHSNWNNEVDGVPLPTALILVRLEAALSAMLGVKGIASVGLRGYGYIQDMCTFASVPNKPCPHNVATLGCGACMVLQLLFYSKTILIRDEITKTLGDNWPSSSDNAASEGRALLDESFGAQRTAFAALNDVSGFEAADACSDESLLLAAELPATVTAEGVLSYGATLQGRGPLGAVPDAAIENPYAGVNSESEKAKLDQGILDDERPISSVIPVLAGQQVVDGVLGVTAGYNPIRGVKPSSQMKIWEGVFSDPRTKVVRVNGQPFAIRIGMVEVEVDEGNAALKTVRSNGYAYAYPKAAEGEGAAALPVYTLSDDGTSLVAPTYASGAVVANVNLPAIGGVSLQGDAESSAAPVSAADALAFLTRKPSVHETLLAADDVQATMPRSRVTISRYDAGTRAWQPVQVVDFALATTNPELMRSNTNDLDFDAVADDENGCIHLAIGSMAIPLDDPSLEARMKNQTVSYARFNVDTGKVEAAASCLELMVCPEMYCACAPRIVMQESDDGARPVLFFSATFKESVAKSYMGTFLKVALASATGDGEFESLDYATCPDSFVTQNCLMGSLQVQPMYAESQGISTKNANLYNLVWTCPAELDDQGNIMRAARLYDWVVSDDGGSLRSNPLCIEGASFATACGTARRTSVEVAYSMDASAAAEKPLHLVRVSAINRNSMAWGNIERVEVGTANVLSYFSNESGSKLYAVRTMEGVAPALPEDCVDALAAGAVSCGPCGSFTSAATENFAYKQDEQEVRLYQLLCAPYSAELGGYFEFFPLAQLDFAPDTVQLVNDNEVSTQFLMSTITDIEQNQAAVYHVTVPRVLGLQMERTWAVNRFALTGQDCYYCVEVSNTGNVPLSGFSTILCSADGKMNMFGTHTNLASCVVDSADNYKQKLDDSDAPTGEGAYEMASDARDAEGILWPGKTRTYQLHFTVPEGFSGETDISVAVGYPIAWSGFTDDVSSVLGECCYAVDPRPRRVAFANAQEAEGRVEPEVVVEPNIYEQLLFGDVNENGKMNIVDVQLAYDCGATQMYDGAEYARMRALADVNGDGESDAADARAIQYALHHGWN